MFGRKKRSDDTRSKTGLLGPFLYYQFETEKMKDAARISDRTIVVLKPQIPIGHGQSAGWFGGDAKLPEGLAWPEQDGEKLLFIGQIDLAAIPKDIWSGCGPRSGWLGIFLSGKGDFRPTVLHFDGPLVDTKAPVPNDAAWTRIFNFDEPRTFALPRWPIVVESLPGCELHNVAQSARSQDQSAGTLLDEGYHPFDRATTELLFKALGESVTRMAQDIIRFPAMKKLRADDAAWFQHQQTIILETFVRFFEIEGQTRAAGFSTESKDAVYIAQLAQLNAYDKQYLRNDGAGYCELVLRETKLLDWQPSASGLRHWWDRYESGLTNHAMKAYVTDPDSLPLPLRRRVEARWQREARDGVAAMGHAPTGHIYTPHGPGTPNEVLLELQTSKMTGWIWGDCYSLVLLIDRDALKRGDFSLIQFDITN